MSLNSELEELFADMAATMPTRRVAAIETVARDIEGSGIVQRALKAGDTAPAFELPDQNGRPVALDTVLLGGPVVLSFNRGGWCPFCNLELRAYQKAYPDIREAGGQILAVLPQSPDRSRAMAEAGGLTFPLLSDRGCEVAEQFGIAFELPAAVREIYAEIGHPLPMFNEAGGWRLPIPATYVIDKDRRIAVADVEPHIRYRLEPLDAIAAIRSLVAPRFAA